MIGRHQSLAIFYGINSKSPTILSSLDCEESFLSCPGLERLQTQLYNWPSERPLSRAFVAPSTCTAISIELASPPTA